MCSISWQYDDQLHGVSWHGDQLYVVLTWWDQLYVVSWHGDQLYVVSCHGDQLYVVSCHGDQLYVVSCHGDQLYVVSWHGDQFFCCALIWWPVICCLATVASYLYCIFTQWLPEWWDQLYVVSWHGDQFFVVPWYDDQLFVVLPQWPVTCTVSLHSDYLLYNASWQYYDQLLMSLLLTVFNWLLLLPAKCNTIYCLYLTYKSLQICEQWCSRFWIVSISHY